MNDRLNKLQTKHNAEVELLEDLKQFSRQRSVLEKQYSEVSGLGMEVWERDSLPFACSIPEPAQASVSVHQQA